MRIKQTNDYLNLIFVVDERLRQATANPQKMGIQPGKKTIVIMVDTYGIRKSLNKFVKIENV